MKLTKVTLAFSMMTAAGPAGVLTEQDGELRADFERRVLWLSPTEFIPFEALRRCFGKQTEHMCLDCGQDFSNKAGLAGHQASKHPKERQMR